MVTKRNMWWVPSPSFQKVGPASPLSCQKKMTEKAFQLISDTLKIPYLKIPSLFWKCSTGPKMKNAIRDGDGSPPQKELKAQYFNNNPSLRLHKFDQRCHVVPQLHLDSCHKVRKKATHRLLETELGERRSEVIHGFLFTKLGRRGVCHLPVRINRTQFQLELVEEVFLLHVNCKLPQFGESCQYSICTDLLLEPLSFKSKCFLNKQVEQ